MDETIYYDENIFYINEIINTIAGGFKLDLMSRLFADKIVEDVLFVEQALSVVQVSLLENEVMINRPKHLRRLARTRGRFAGVLDLIVKGDHSFAEVVEPFRPRFRELAAEQRRHVAVLRDLLHSAADSVGAESEVVSEQEFRFLLSDAGDSEEFA